MTVWVLGNNFNYMLTLVVGQCIQNIATSMCVNAIEISTFHCR